MRNICIFILCAVISVSVWAADISFETTVSSNKVSLGETFTLSLTVEGTQDVNAIDIPSFNGMQVMYAGSSRRVSIINGVSRPSITHSYSVLPTKTGVLTIPSMSITVQGKDIISDSIKVSVVSGSEGESGESESLSDRMFVKLVINNKEVYIGQKIPIKIYLYVAVDVPLQDVQLPDLEQIGFIMEDFKDPVQYGQTLNGIKYQIVEFSAHIYPTRMGDIKIGPVSVPANLVMRENGGNDFFGSIFSRVHKRPITLSSNAEILNIIDLPQEGRPDNFSGAVGEFSFNASVGPNKVQLGDPLTLRMMVKGEGNLKTVEFPQLKDDRFKIYDPQIKEEGGVKILEQVLIPMDENIAQVPGIEFSYFNSEKHQYQKVTQGPFDIEVSPAPEGKEFKMVGFEQTVPAVMTKQEKFGRDIIFIKDEIGKLHRKGSNFFGSAMFWICIISYCLIWMGIFSWHYFQQRLSTDKNFMRRVFAYKNALNELKNMRSLIEEGDSRKCYELLYKLFKNYLADKYGLPQGEMEKNQINGLLNTYYSDKVDFEVLNLFFDRCEQARFTSQDTKDDFIQSDYELILSTIKCMEKKI